MWQDMGLYWAWRDCQVVYCAPPTMKRIEYAHISYTSGIEMNIAATVFDDDIPRDVNRNEIAWHASNGAAVKL